MHLSQKRKIFSQFLFAFSGFWFNFEHFQKKEKPAELMYFWSYGIRKTRLDKYLKKSVSRDTSTSNMENGPKHFSKLNYRTFTIFIHPCELNSGWKSLSEPYAKYHDCLLTDWHPITRFFFLIVTIYSNIFRWNYLRNGKYFLNFFLRFLNLDSILNIFRKKMTLKTDVFLTLQTPKNVVR